MYGLGFTYILIDTEFKKTAQKLGELDQYANSIGNELAKIDRHLLFLAEKSHDFDLTQFNIVNMYDDNVMVGAEFRAIIINHHYLHHPHTHILYTILKYDIIKKEFYFDLFLTNTQHIKRCCPLLKRHCPIMSNAIFDIAKADIEDVQLLYKKIKTIKSFIQNSTNEHINYNSTRIHLKIQKSIHSYLKEKQIVYDTQLKLDRKLCGEMNPKTNCINEDIYNFVITAVRKIVDEKALEIKNYTIVATTLNLLKNNIIYEKQGEDDKHAESLLVNFNYKNTENMEGFKRHDLIFVIRLYQNGSVGVAYPCQRCVRILTGNGINKVVFSIDKSNYQILEMNETTYTYTTTGSKLLHIDTYLYEKYIVYRRLREE